MARKYLGDTIDIHGGGVDLKFPHHENEIAQSEGFSGKAFCNCWLHNGFVNINDEKMSKSLGNFKTLRSACPEPHQVRAYRYLIISSQYRNPLSFTPEVMAAAQKTVKRIDRVTGQIKEALKGQDIGEDESRSQLATDDIPKALQNFEAAIIDDLSMPRAAAALFAIIKAVEKEFKTKAKDSSHTLDLPGLQAAHNALLRMDKIFGIFYDVPTTKDDGQNENENKKPSDDSIPPEVLELVSKRAAAKEFKDWELADSLRAQISELGFEVKDVKGGDPEISRQC
jgi:cysteinyl-tRNA synthetase